MKTKMVVKTNLIGIDRSSSLDGKESLDERERGLYRYGMIVKFVLSDVESDLVVFLSLILFVAPEDEHNDECDHLNSEKDYEESCGDAVDLGDWRT